jgi:hypothetical protein
MIRILSLEVDCCLFLQGQQSVVIKGSEKNLIIKGGRCIKKNNTLFLLNDTKNYSRIVKKIKPIH